MRFTDTISLDAPAGKAEARLFVDPNADYLKDHFPDAPMLPGLVMLEAAVRVASALWQAKNFENDKTTSTRDDMQFASLARVERLAVTRRVVPHETLKVEVELIADNTTDATEALFAARASVEGEAAMRARFRLRIYDAVN
ncbi:MAG: hypothetical protein NVSMB56_19160 [Pyrinomonadaceae bacterium]